MSSLLGSSKDAITKRITRTVAPAYQLEVDAPPDLRRLLVTYLDLSRFQSAPESEEITRAELDRMVAAGLGDLDKSGIAELTFPGRHAHP